MKKIERLENGRKCFEYLVNSGKIVYSSLTNVELNGIYSLVSLRNWLDAYVEYLSVSDPDNELLKKYYELLEEKKISQANVIYTKDINEFLDVKPDDVNEYLTSLPQEKFTSLRRRLKDVMDSTTDSNLKIKIQLYYSMLIGFQEQKRQLKRSELKLQGEKLIKDLIKAYIDSSCIEIIYLPIYEYGFERASLNDKLKDISESIENNTDKYSDELKELYSEYVLIQKSREATLVAVINEMVPYMEFDNPGRSSKFTLFDYYNFTTIPLNELITAARNLVRDGSIDSHALRIIENFKNNSLMDLDRVNKDKALNYYYSYNGRVITKEEMQSVINHLESRNIPLLEGVYRDACYAYLSGKLTFPKLNK